VSPFRPGQAERYPKDWKEIRGSILERAQFRCECRGECGSEHGSVRRVERGDSVVDYHSLRCNVPDKAEIERDPARPEKWRMHEHGGTCMGEKCASTLIVLTIAHLDHNPENCAPANLRAFCQRCHLRYDASEHAKNAAATRHARRATGDLFG
jgi:hypothetical protein